MLLASQYRIGCCATRFLCTASEPIVESVVLRHWFKNWQEQRKYKLTASTFAQAIGFWPGRRVQLWLEKIGAVEPFTGNLATCWNNIKEEEALERYKLITGNSVMLPEFQKRTFSHHLGFGLKKFPALPTSAIPGGVALSLPTGLAA